MGIFNVHNSGVSLFLDNKLLYASLEERFNREKFTKCFPINAIRNCLENTNLTYDDIDVIAYGGYTYPNQDSVRDFLSSINDYGLDKSSDRLCNSLSVDYFCAADFHVNVKKYFPNAKIEYYDHHYAHACTAFYFSGFVDGYVITSDGRGDLQSTVIWKSVDRKLKRVKTFCELKSFGFLYGQITYLLGFKAHRHEGKVTGLAAFGTYSDLCEKLLELIRFDKKIGDIKVSKYYNAFNQPFKMDYLKEITNGYTKEDIAFAVQYVLEKNMIELINYYIPENSNLCVAGGIFGNVKLNQRIREHTKLNSYFVFPEMGDGGISCGSAIASSIKHGNISFELNNMFLGPKFIWDNIDLSNYNVIKYDSEKLFIGKVVELIVNNKVIGLFADRMEYGPRALGARSIIIQAVDKSINDIVNKRLNRTEFMPFAPFTLKEFANIMYKNFNDKDINTKYMTTCYECSDEMKKMSPAVVHVDNTARPQIIDDSFPIRLYRKILEGYYNKTGIPNLVNTSFNNHEEPIVCTPIDALDSLDKGNVDYIINDELMIISKK